MSVNPEIGNSITAGGLAVNYHDMGSGAAVLLIHGSGPGVSAYANWRLTLPELGRHYRVIAPDILGFGYSERPADNRYDMNRWLSHLTAFLDALGLNKVSVIGNSFGGALALALAIQHPGRVDRLVLMGAVGLDFPITDGLDQVWGYEPSIEKMKRLLRIFAYDASLLSDNLAEIRYRASTRPGVQEAYAAMFPTPRQNGVRMLAQSEDVVKALPHQTLIIHGREDKVIPSDVSVRLSRLIEKSELHIFGQCGHWVQIEKSARFVDLVSGFLQADGARGKLA